MCVYVRARVRTPKKKKSSKRRLNVGSLVLEVEWGDWIKKKVLVKS